ncbi:MAG: hypothetical protein HLUCCX10_12420 [Algoriphagus marincola HL-49]|uniref:Outer membrane protein beta-barrel domain n=1 Tax=Algoriphagus marincola HL-49 TaxID=1305737 RepID=A0A0P7YG87_9BACT|nr:MAG: hypothetical protein HLUCCX10_12420 [Algoriphagus marincola HL-49]
MIFNYLISFSLGFCLIFDYILLRSIRSALKFEIMKKLALGLFIILVTIFNSSAQESKVEVRAGYGILSAQAMGSVLSNSIVGGLSGYEKTDISTGGVFMFSLLFNPSNRISFGLDFGYEKLDVLYESPSQPNVTSTDRFITVMPRIDLRYVNKEAYSLYGSLAAGGSFLSAGRGNESEQGVAFAYQITPIGIRFGNNIALFAEAGFGFRGLLNAGLSVRL